MQQCSCVSTQDEYENISSEISCESVQDENESKQKKTKKQKNKISYVVKVKTEICKYWAVEGYCPYGKQCAFAHGKHEVRQKIHVPHNYKTQICKNYTKDGYCCYGERCQFKHPEKKLHKLPTITYQLLLSKLENINFDNNFYLMKNSKRSKGLPQQL